MRASFLFSIFLALLLDAAAPAPAEAPPEAQDLYEEGRGYLEEGHLRDPIPGRALFASRPG